jgi:hypothetical protein
MFDCVGMLLEPLLLACTRTPTTRWSRWMLFVVRLQQPFVCRVVPVSLQCSCRR